MGRTGQRGRGLRAPPEDGPPLSVNCVAGAAAKMFAAHLPAPGVKMFILTWSSNVLFGGMLLALLRDKDSTIARGSWQ